jgi:hypothetical protein
MFADRRQVAQLQSDFYRNQYHRIIRWLIVAIVTIFILIIGILYIILSHPTRQYYASTSEGRILPMEIIATK